MGDRLDNTAASTRDDLVTLGDEEQVLKVVSSSVLQLWDVVNNLTRLRPTTRQRYRVTIFGSARVPKDHWVYRGRPRPGGGAHAAGVRHRHRRRAGADAGGERGRARSPTPRQAQSTGIRVDLPFEQEANAFVTEAFEHRTFFTRLHHFVLVSDAFVVVPGGIGTVLETMMIWQLLQVRKLHDVPLILAGRMYADLVEWCRQYMLRPDCPLASAAGHDDPGVRGGRRRRSCRSSANITRRGRRRAEGQA